MPRRWLDEQIESCIWPITKLPYLTREGFSVLHRDQGKVRVNIQPLEVGSGEASLEGFDHYMLKEIYEQPESIRNAMRGRLGR